MATAAAAVGLSLIASAISDASKLAIKNLTRVRWNRRKVGSLNQKITLNKGTVEEIDKQVKAELDEEKYGPLEAVLKGYKEILDDFNDGFADWKERDCCTKFCARTKDYQALKEFDGKLQNSYLFLQMALAGDLKSAMTRMNIEVKQLVTTVNTATTDMNAAATKINEAANKVENAVKDQSEASPHQILSHDLAKFVITPGKKITQINYPGDNATTDPPGLYVINRLGNTDQFMSIASMAVEAAELCFALPKALYLRQLIFQIGEMFEHRFWYGQDLSEFEGQLEEVTQLMLRATTKWVSKKSKRFTNVDKKLVSELENCMEGPPIGYNYLHFLTCSLKEMREPRENHAAVCFGSESLVVLGGFNSRSQYLASVELWDFNMSCWKPLPPFTLARSKFAAVSVNRKIFAFGGVAVVENKTVRLRSALVLDLDKTQDGWIDLPDMSSTRAGCNAAVVGNLIYVVGGCKGSTVEVFDTTSDSWRSLPAMDSQDYVQFGAVVGGSRMILMGDNDVKEYEEKKARFPWQTSMWTESTNSRTSIERSSFGATTFNENVIVVGGVGGSIYTPVSHVDLYNRKVGKWVSLGELRTVRRGCSVSLVGSRLVVLGGYNGATYLNSAEIIDVADLAGEEA